jgi:putative transcriptional regulator
MSIQHHPDVSTLMSYAAGSLGEALSAVVIAHIVRCPACRTDVRRLEMIGATVFGQAGSIPVGEAPVVSAAATERAPPPGDRIPDPLGIVLAGGLATFRWRWLGPGVHHHRLPLSAGAVGDLRLLKIAPGRQMPAHGHGGSELTLVLEGAYHDETGRFGPGDVEDVDGATEHQPIADPATGCICLIASERAARFKGLLGRLVQPLTGM